MRYECLMIYFLRVLLEVFYLDIYNLYSYIYDVDIFQSFLSFEDLSFMNYPDIISNSIWMLCPSIFDKILVFSTKKVYVCKLQLSTLAIIRGFSDYFPSETLIPNPPSKRNLVTLTPSLGPKRMSKYLVLKGQKKLSRQKKS